MRLFIRMCSMAAIVAGGAVLLTPGTARASGGCDWCRPDYVPPANTICSCSQSPIPHCIHASPGNQCPVT